jgi:hypothetical protein
MARRAPRQPAHLTRSTRWPEVCDHAAEPTYTLPFAPRSLPRTLRSLRRMRPIRSTGSDRAPPCTPFVGVLPCVLAPAAFIADDGCVTRDDVLAANESNHVALRTAGIGHVTGR